VGERGIQNDQASSGIYLGYTSAGRLLARGEVPNLLLIQYQVGERGIQNEQAAIRNAFVLRVEYLRLVSRKSGSEAYSSRGLRVEYLRLVSRKSGSEAYSKQRLKAWFPKKSIQGKWEAYE
jgi:hypothetical protein